MERKTLKIDKGEYTNFSNEFDDHDVILLSGARGSGKSYPTAKYISSILEKDETSKFIYMRISFSHLKTFAGWCEDLNLSKIAGTEKTKLTRGKPTGGDILLCGYDENDKIVYERVIGKCMSLEKSSEFKSGKYDDFKVLVFEECVQKSIHPEDEKKYVFDFLENVVSIFRDRPKKIFLLSNQLKNIPLLDKAIDELTGELFKNPIKIKIFRKSENKKTNSFLDYLNGEVYDDDIFKINMSEFFILFSNKKFVVYQHKVFYKKYYITANINNKKRLYNSTDFLRLKNFCTGKTSNEFYYQNDKIEKSFFSDYEVFIQQIALFIVENGGHFIL